ncbi:hypothetical protein CASFOL_014951 [Castilleja foliolosa]|uniref:Uncharacterized protein n=1 Tax=Castilleja foliolosa TaxID=1961234 RepID=A0ABD3DCR5_9LAMI
MAGSFRLECRAGPMRRRVWWRKKMNKSVRLASGLGNYVDALVRRNDIALLSSSR